MREITTKVYHFDELSEPAKEIAREAYRVACAHEFSDFGHDYVLQDAAEVCALLGVSLKTQHVPLMSGKTREQPVIMYSGFSSQGDGACFEGTYGFKPGVMAAIKKHAPDDKDLHAIAGELYALQAAYQHQLQATVTHTGHYTNHCSVTIEVERDGDGEVKPEAVKAVKEALQDLMQWIYRQLEREYEYQQSAEYVDEQIRSNEYEFTDDGKRARV